jgi:hypothetical protein
MIVSCSPLLGLDDLENRLPPAPADGGESPDAKTSACHTPVGWLAGFTGRTPIHVGNTAAAVSDYQVRLSLDVAARIASGNMEADAHDLRVTADDGVTILPHWIEPQTIGSSTLVVWTRVPTIPSSGTTVYVYSGAPTVPATSDRSATFLDGIVKDPTFHEAGQWTLIGPTNGGTGSVRLPGSCPGGCVEFSLVREPNDNGSALLACQWATFPPSETSYSVVVDVAITRCIGCAAFVTDDEPHEHARWKAYAPLHATSVEAPGLKAGETLPLCFMAQTNGSKDLQAVTVSFANIRVRRSVDAGPRAERQGADEHAPCL